MWASAVWTHRSWGLCRLWTILDADTLHGLRGPHLSPSTKRPGFSLFAKCALMWQVILGSEISLVWWLILCVNLTGRRDAQIAGETLFLDASVRVALEEISIWVGRLRKEDWPHQCRQGASNLLRAWTEHKGTGRADSLSLLEWRHPPSPALGYLCSWFSGIWTQTGIYTQPPNSWGFALGLN